MLIFLNLQILGVKLGVEWLSCDFGGLQILQERVRSTNKKLNAQYYLHDITG